MQTILPMIPEGNTPISNVISVVRQKDSNDWFYFCGVYPVFSHAKDDLRSFRMFTAQLVCKGMCKQAEIIRTFGVSKSSVQRSVQKYTEGGIDAFFVSKKKDVEEVY